MKRTMILIATLAMMFSVVVMAGNATYEQVFVKNDMKRDSPTNRKPNDEDYKVYVTPLASSGGSVSTVFPNGGTLYARARLHANPENVYSPVLVFVSNVAKTGTYATGMAKFGQYYNLRTEVSGCNFNGETRYQWIRWCP